MLLYCWTCDFRDLRVSQGRVSTINRCGGISNHLSTAYLLSNNCTKNYWNRTTMVETTVGGWVVSFFETQCMYTVHINTYLFTHDHTSALSLPAVMYVSFGQGSSLLWTHALRLFYSRPIALKSPLSYPLVLLGSRTRGSLANQRAGLLWVWL